MAAPGASPIGAGYTTSSHERHRPEETILYPTLQAHWKTFLEEVAAEAETSALRAFVVVDRVIPRCPVRQWVLTVPYSLRARMMFDPALTTVVLRELIAAVSSWLRRRARRLGIKGVVLKTGAVTVIQRFNSALGASPHFHTLQ